MSLSQSDILNQSKRAYGQWCEQWRRHAKEHGEKYPMRPMSDLENIGIGRAVLCVANGYSLEEEIQTIREHQDRVDIIVCDKALGHLLANGIRPRFCLVADANVNYEKYLKPYETQLQDTILIANVCANPLWAANGNWKDRFFYSVQDVLQSEKEWRALSGCPNTMVAGTNVSNSLVIAVTQSDNGGRRNFMGYDKILLIGFDYSWAPDGRYYAFDQDAGGKWNYMRHAYLMDARGKHCWSSSNLIFSARWLESYVSTFKLPVVQCTKRTVFGTLKRGILREQMQYTFRPENQGRVKRLIELRRTVAKMKREYESEIQTIARDHYYSYLESVS